MIIYIKHGDKKKVDRSNEETDIIIDSVDNEIAKGLFRKRGVRSGPEDCCQTHIQMHFIGIQLDKTSFKSLTSQRGKC